MGEPSSQVSEFKAQERQEVFLHFSRSYRKCPIVDAKLPTQAAIRLLPQSLEMLGIDFLAGIVHDRPAGITGI